VNEGRDVIRKVVFLLALALAHPALAQTAPTPAPKPSPAKPVAKKPAPPKPDAVAQRGPCIGVIPHIGKRFVVQKVGLTMFNNEHKEVPIESWELGDLVVARVRAAADTRFAVRRIAYPANAFAPYDNPPLFHIPENDLKGVVQTVAHGSGCERYVAVVESASQFSNTNQTVKGIGIVNSGLFNSGATRLFVLTALFVFDGHTFDVLKKGAGTVDPERSGGDSLLPGLILGSAIRGPSRGLKDFSWPPALDAVMSLRDPTHSLLAESLDKVLPKLLEP
jgi:hypothetical protein